MSSKRSKLAAAQKLKSSGILRQLLREHCSENRFRSSALLDLMFDLPVDLTESEQTVLRETMEAASFNAQFQKGVPAIGSADTQLKQLASQNLPRLAEAGRSIGRIEMTQADSSLRDGEKAVGTGWVFGENLIMTAGHVAKDLLDWRNALRSEFSPRIDFGEELGDDTNRQQFPIVNVESIDPRLDANDFAVLRTSGGPLPPPLRQAAVGMVPVDNKVYTIGYPDNLDSGRSYTKVLSVGLVESIFDSKGKMHCTYETEEGLSGAPVLSLLSHQVVAVHQRYDPSKGSSLSTSLGVILSAIANPVPQSVSQALVSSTDLKLSQILSLPLMEILDSGSRGDLRTLRRAQQLIRATLKDLQRDSRPG